MLIHTVVKVFQIGGVQAGLGFFVVSFETHVPCTHPVEGMGCSGPMGSAV